MYMEEYLILISVVFIGFIFPAYADEQNNTVPFSAEEVSPLPVGTTVPKVQIRAASGESYSTHEVLGKEPTILIFYRGGWCPYCNTHLGRLATIEDELVALGFKIVAVSPDSPETIRKNNEKLKESGVEASTHYQIYSDSKMNLAKAFGLAFKVDDETVSMYKEKYQIDLEGDSGETHHLLPVPAAYVIDAAGTITFRYFNPDYKQRVEIDTLLAAAKKATK